MYDYEPTKPSSEKPILDVVSDQLTKIFRKDRLVYIVIVCILMFAVERAVTHAAIRFCQISGFTSAINRLTGGISLSVEPVLRSSTPHKFLFIGHTHFTTKYHIRIENKGAKDPGIARLQITSETGHISAISSPPIAKLRFSDGPQAHKWKGKGHAKDSKSIVLDFHVVPEGTSVTFVVSLERMDQHVPDEDLLVQLAYKDLFLEKKAPKATWEDQGKK